MPRHDFTLNVMVNEDKDSSSEYEMCIDYTVSGRPMPATDTQPAEGYEIEMGAAYQYFLFGEVDCSSACDLVTDKMKEHLADEIYRDLNRKEGD